MATAPLTAPLTATHLLRFEARRALEGLHLIGGIAAFIGCRRGRTGAATTATTGRGIFLIRRLCFLSGHAGPLSIFWRRGRGLVRLLRTTAATGLGLGLRIVRLRLSGRSLGRVGLTLFRGLLGTTTTLGGCLFARSRFFV